jgi:predicted molibdopterin-dependent oxidoreductase YjgC
MKPSGSAQHSTDEAAQPRMARLVDGERARLTFSLDGTPSTAQEGDTILTAVLTVRRYLVESACGEGKRAGFCLMGACQECWVAVDGTRARACSTLVTAGMSVATGGHFTGG